MRIVSVRASRPRRLVVLFDASGSMSATESKWKLANAVASMVVDNAPPDLSLSLAAFAETTHQMAAFGDDRSAIRKAIDNLNTLKRQKGSSKGTVVLDAVSYAANLMQPPQAGDVILLITDGGENHSKEDAAALHRLLLASGIRVSLIFFLDPRPSPGVQSHGEHNFQDLIHSTGGMKLTVAPSGVLTAPGPIVMTPDYSVAKPDLERLNSEIRGMYLIIMSPFELEIELPGRLNKLEHWDLQYKDERLGKSPIQVFYPAELLPCDGR